MMADESSDMESQFEEELEIVTPPKGLKSGPWGLGKIMAVSVGVITAVVLVIMMPIAHTKGGGNSSSMDNVAMDLVVGTDGQTIPAPVDVVAEDPIDSVSPTENEVDTNTNTTKEEMSNTPVPTATLASVVTSPVPTMTLAPVATETACSALNTTGGNGTGWVEITENIIGESANDLSGRNIAMSADGSILAIAAAMNNGNGERAGHVRVYQYTSGQYSQMGQDLDGEAEFDWFGTSLALDASGYRLAVGSRWNDGRQGNDTGHVRLFDYSRSSGIWEKVGDDLEGGAQGDQFGRSVALSADGTRLAVGATHADASANATDVGHVYVYELSGGSFLHIGDFQGDSKDDLSGGTVSLSADGSHIAIAANLHDGLFGMTDVGQVKIFRFDSGTKLWSQVGADIVGNAPRAQAGYTLALSFDGSRVAVGYPQSIMGIPAPGITRVYELRDGSWEKVGANDLIGGHFVSISRNGRVAVGDYLGYLSGINAGFVHVYELNREAKAWDLVGQVINGEIEEMSGTSLALSADGMRVAISSPRASPDGLMDIGAVRVYDLC